MNRRSFINNLSVCGASLTLSPTLFSFTKAPEKKIRFALIGKGGMGSADCNTALRVPQAELIAVCDIYKPRLAAAKKEWGEHLKLESNYKNILADPTIDAVIIATPDHWHQRIAVDALNSGKHVYCEKPIIHKRSEAKALIKAQKQSGKIFQMGTQGVSSVGIQLAKVLLESGIIGPLNFVDARFSSAPGMLNSFQAPAEATPTNLWWDQFIGEAPKQAFTPQRFFAWRNWSDYGTGLAGDLFVHVLASIHYITGCKQPKKVYSDGDILYYNDGSRDTPDLIYSLFDYTMPDEKSHFKVSLGANVLDGVSKQWGSTDFSMIGLKGTMRVTWDTVTIKTHGTVNTEGLEERLAQLPGFGAMRKISDYEVQFSANPEYPDAHFLHFQNFFHAIRDKSESVAPVEFGVYASSAALMSFESQMKKQII
ncbi:gfo/Idh/MocA family oxidoreductase [Sphingobacterium sp. DK4209]|uniref:Gfo/Idh/MocA family oxidoreductase n=1 Tax=Sphingobacterium zhuxiongii TaxID=2662364 RepID=A0A5Q0QA05_9SPHI|nr:MULTISPECIES: Gfo/Idh/MocA family oxidoreductase [unclassified Sphingobacterium]MVZ64607.1 gfo/Idh/MocA family oxidoreductase [Sphingobacterium sp. DK4209]QGA26947.1 gfo/Idh/MocA family oxidoreductase [Sphingobacterium sp. dk4302]